MESNAFMDNLIELRARLIRCSLAIIVCFLCLIYFSNDIYQLVAEPIQTFLPENSSMIATEVASPFLTPLKLTFYVSLLISLPIFISSTFIS